MVQESKIRSMGGQTNGSSNGSSMYRQPEKSSANFGSSIQKMKMTNTGSPFGSAKSNDPGKTATNSAVWGQFKSRDQFVSMHFS
ncbi:AAEL008785-PA [Aedes aegypti]|uniref:AAEL008785-PA n=1 Tax=Aedes aegypti TaxID=7159 RepID=Q16XQ4_AEDAE|nr:AAEL008785-PA [Aedes aegypti]